MSHNTKEFTNPDLSNLMKTSSLRPFATLAALRFKFFPSSSTLIERRYSASRAVGDKWDGHGLSSSRLRRASSPALPLLCALGVLAFHPSATASTTWTGPTWTVSTVIPDNDEVGFTDTRMVTIPAVTEIESLTVNLNFTGGWNGDLYAYLVHGDGFAVLLNRPGRSLANPDGSATVGMNITFDDAAFSDIHTAIPMSGGSVSGIYQPDGRETDPYNTLDTNARPAMLVDFIGLNPNGTWKLFVADQSPGEESTLQSWSLSITAVPEPGAAMLGGLGALLLLWRRR